MKSEFYLILPNIRSSHNVGAMFRTADACGVTKIFLVGYTPIPPRPDIHKVALGADEWVPWEQRKTLKPLLKSLKKNGVKIIALEKNEKSVTIETLSVSSSVALIVGNEVDGISSDILDFCDVVAHIPMRGRKESLNVSIAGGIGMYEIGNRLYRSL
jgi:tRNA G18 (ribose-2'-O)-methylase SpoU